MKKYPVTIKEIIKEVSEDQDHSMEDILFFLQEVICLLEDYDGLGECLAYICNNLKAEASGAYKEYLPLTEIFSKLCLSDRERLLLEEQKEVLDAEEAFRNAQQQYLTAEEDQELIEQIGETAYYLNEPVVHATASILSARLSSEAIYGRIGQQVMDLQNIGFLIEMLSEQSNTFALVCDENQEVNWDVLSNMVSRLGHKVVMLVKTEDQTIDVAYSIAHMEHYEDVSVLLYTDQSLQELVNYVCENESKDHLACLIATGNILDRLMINMERGCEVERLSLMKTPVLQDKLTFGWAGDYLSYVSKIYKCDAHEDVDAKPKYRFSFVIPTKNSADTLRYTLMTCMNQRWKGSYEILVSDNSTEGNDAIYSLCKELGEKDERIHYVRTPRPLVIGKSFEYAFLKTRGEFIIPLGADDGVLPWTLEALEEILENCPDEILMWNRGQYQWPDFGQGISDQFVFPCQTPKGIYPMGYQEGIKFLVRTLQIPKTMYGLPLLYLNSGFRRTYMKTLLKKTGRLWDGPCQDIFMGIVNSVIHKEICMVNYPLTMAGMAHCSTGARYTRQLDTLEKVNMRGRNKELGENSYIGGWCSSPVERLVPRITSDIGLFYNSVIRIVAKKLLPIEVIEQNFNMKKWYLELYGLMHKRELIYERQIREMHYAAKQNGEEFLRWFEKELWEELVRAESPEIQKEVPDDVKIYETKVYEDGTVVMDASNYGVENIYQATLLAERVSEY